jgi:hypothetical protein
MPSACLPYSLGSAALPREAFSCELDGEEPGVPTRLDGPDARLPPGDSSRDHVESAHCVIARGSASLASFGRTRIRIVHRRSSREVPNPK